MILRAFASGRRSEAGCKWRGTSAIILALAPRRADNITLQRTYARPDIPFVLSSLFPAPGDAYDGGGRKQEGGRESHGTGTATPQRESAPFGQNTAHSAQCAL
ncbi:hypothetical protein K438DRAFT_1845044, partial [Mycena galopus ATCC 62051]